MKLQCKSNEFRVPHPAVVRGVLLQVLALGLDALVPSQLPQFDVSEAPHTSPGSPAEVTF